MIIRQCNETDIEEIYSIINDAAEAYRGHLEPDCWHEPYMPMDYLRGEIDSGVVFWGYEENGRLIGVMGIQDIQDVTLIRHAYVRTTCRRKGIGGRLIRHLLTLSDRPTMIGTWKAATWAIDFYAKYGFELVTEEEKERLLRKYWSIPERQITTSVVMVDEKCNVERA
ncbi:MAG: GNAT family N-acetyltransferase [Pirellulales bacterium]|nr:GNAT family N-acetyltransferase [Pirellulales bacterium]